MPSSSSPCTVWWIVPVPLDGGVQWGLIQYGKTVASTQGTFNVVMRVSQGGAGNRTSLRREKCTGDRLSSLCIPNKAEGRTFGLATRRDAERRRSEIIDDETPINRFRRNGCFSSWKCIPKFHLSQGESVCPYKRVGHSLLQGQNMGEPSRRSYIPTYSTRRITELHVCVCSPEQER